MPLPIVSVAGFAPIVPLRIKGIACWSPQNQGLAARERRLAPLEIHLGVEGVVVQVGRAEDAAAGQDELVQPKVLSGGDQLAAGVDLEEGERSIVGAVGMKEEQLAVRVPLTRSCVVS